MLRFQRDGYSVDAAIAKGRPLPEWYVDEPLTMPADDFYFTAFDRLSTCRQLGMGLGPIPWDKVIDYAHRCELDDEMTDAFVTIISQMDQAFRGWHDDQAERGRRQAEAESKAKAAQKAR